MLRLLERHRREALSATRSGATRFLAHLALPLLGCWALAGWTLAGQ